MSFRKRFIYRDIHSTAFKQWKRVKEDEVPEKLIKPSKNYRSFVSVQMFEKPRHEDGEVFWMPVFFDLDHKKDLDVPLADAKKLVVYFTKQLDIPAAFVRVYFSGSKGFHVIVAPEVFDMRPDPELHLKVKKACLFVSELLKLKAFDHTVYSIRRMLRAYNSIHEKTKLYKIELSHQELNKGIPWIKEKAKMPQKEPVWDAEEVDDIGIVEDAAEFWKTVTFEVAEAKELSNLNPDQKIKDFGDNPVCVKHILEISRQPRANNGNRTILALAAYMKDAGHPELKALAVLIPWGKAQQNIGNAGQERKVEAAVRSTVKYVYSTDKRQKPYHFACKYILALGTSEHKIPCQGIQCPAIRGKMQETKETIELQLGEFSKSIYLGEVVKVPCLVSGKAGTPYVVPKRIRFNCTPDDEKGFCGTCPISGFNGEASFEFGVQDKQILEIINVSNGEMWNAIRRKWRFPHQCQKMHSRVEEYMNVEEIRMAPAVVDVSNFKKMEFVARKGIYLDYPLESNKRYMMEGYPVTDPKTQASTFLFEKIEKLETEVEMFKMSPAILDELSIFKCKEQSIEEKFHDIHADLAANVHRIWNRENMAWAIDLVAHSVRGFRFRKERFVKGWVELLIIGDSGQGKTTLARKILQEHYKVGDMISGGSAKRTGLLYSFQESGRTWMLVWGAVPLNDLGLIIIDEFGDLPEDEFAKFTDVRSSGIVKATGVVSAETFGRVRLLCLTNAKSGRTLSTFTYPCYSLKGIVPAAEDIRRFDFACAVASGEVSSEIINTSEEPTVDHVFTSHLCSELIRWTWSRTENQIRFSKEASELVLSEAIRMGKDFHAGEVPLVEPADQRFKIARLSAAVAARVFSTDKSGENLIVTAEHVMFATTVLYMLYKDDNFKYDEWSNQQRTSQSADRTEIANTFTEIQKTQSWKKVIALLTMPGNLEMRDLEGVLGGRQQAASVANVLRVLGVIEKRWGKFFKTPKGNALVEYIIKVQNISREELQHALIDGQGEVF